MSKSGYVYILSNPSMPDIVKIGMSVRGGTKRAEELHNTGTPTPFKLEFEIYVDDCREIESLVHDALHDNRVSNGREFFKLEVNAAIESLITIYTENNLGLCLIDFEAHEGISNLAELSYKIGAHPFEVMTAVRFISLSAMTDAHKSYLIWRELKAKRDSVSGGDL